MEQPQEVGVVSPRKMSHISLKRSSMKDTDTMYRDNPKIPKIGKDSKLKKITVQTVYREDSKEGDYVSKNGYVNHSLVVKSGKFIPSFPIKDFKSREYIKSPSIEKKIGYNTSIVDKPWKSPMDIPIYHYDQRSEKSTMHPQSVQNWDMSDSQAEVILGDPTSFKTFHSAPDSQTFVVNNNVRYCDSQSFYDYILKINHVFRIKFPAQAKILVQDLVTITQHAGNHFISETPKTQQEITGVFQSIKYDLLSSHIKKHSQGSVGNDVSSFLTQLLHRLQFCYTSNFIFQVKTAFELFSPVSELQGFSRCEEALKSGINFITQFWKKEISRYKNTLDDSTHISMRIHDARRGGSRSFKVGFTTSDPEYYTKFFDTVAFERYHRTATAVSWRLFSIWLKSHAPQWYELDFQSSKDPLFPDVSQAIKKRLNDMVRQQVVQFHKNTCLFEYKENHIVEFRNLEHGNITKRK